MTTVVMPLGSADRPPGHDSGAATVEVLVASVVGLMILVTAVAFIWDQIDAAATQPEMAELQQRGRLAGELLNRSIASAGTWGDHGGPLQPASCCVPVVQPRRIGVWSADPSGTTRSDVLTLARVRAGAAPAAVDQLVAGTLTVRLEAGCPPGSAACGLREDDHVAVFHESGRHDFLIVDAVGGLTAAVSPRQSGTPANFGADAVAVAVETETYFFDQSRRQLRLYDGYHSDVPIVDDVVAVRFDYFGEAGVPTRARTAGDSCWFDDQGLPKFGRTVTPAGAALVPLALNAFEDGPWCGQGENRFDADLLRVRFVRAVLRLRASAAAVRGQGVAFLDPGRATSGRRFVPDLEVEIGSALRVPGGN